MTTRTARVVRYGAVRCALFSFLFFLGDSDHVPFFFFFWLEVGGVLAFRFDMGLHTFGFYIMNGGFFGGGAGEGS